MKPIKSWFAAALLCGSLAIQGAIPSGYYSALEGKCGADLKAAVKAAVSRVSTVGYSDGTWESFKKTDTRTVNGVLVWWDMYCNNLVAVSSGHPGLNVEHSVPNSWWGGTKNNAYKDLHHLNPSDSKANGWKGYYCLGTVNQVHVTSKGEVYDNGVTKVGKPKSGESGGSPMVFEPHDDYKGDFARAYFYMFTMYDDIPWQSSASDRNYMFDGSSYPTLRQWAQTLLLNWASKDPVSEKELNRNEAVYGEQNNRNPFIDFPDLCDYIWGVKKTQPFHVDDEHGGSQPADPNDPKDPDDPVNPPVIPGIQGTWQKVGAGYAPSVTDRYVLLSAKGNFYMRPEISSTYLNYGSPLTVTDGVIEKVPEDIAVVRFEPVGTGYVLRLENVNGDLAGYLKIPAAKKAELVSEAASGTVANVSCTSDGVSIDYGQYGKLQYNASAPRFVTYTSEQEPLAMYREVNQSSGTEVAADDLDGEVQMYDLNGRLMPEGRPEPGIYIVRTSKRAYKMVVK